MNGVLQGSLIVRLRHVFSSCYNIYAALAELWTIRLLVDHFAYKTARLKCNIVYALRCKNVELLDFDMNDGVSENVPLIASVAVVR